MMKYARSYGFCKNTEYGTATILLHWGELSSILVIGGVYLLVDLRVIETLSYLGRLRGFPASRIHPGPL